MELVLPPGEERADLKDVEHPALPVEDRPFFKIAVDVNGNYSAETNMGEAWKWHALKIAKAIREEVL
jgi:hypothetical protein